MRNGGNFAIKLSIILFLFGLAATFQSLSIGTDLSLVLTYCFLSLGIAALIILVLPLVKRPKKHLGVILAAGQSTRWNASIREPESEFYWENVRRVQQNLLDRGMASLRDDIIRGPTPNEITSIGEHKALIKVDGDELIYRTIRLFGERQIDTVYPVLGKKSEPIKDYLHSIRELKLERLWAHMPKWRETLPTVDSGGTTYSAVIGLVEAHKAMHDDDYVIMAYSDIIWELRLLDSLMSTQGDIVVLADGRWADFNYPPNRIWHDKFQAELISTKKWRRGRIEKAGEAAHRFYGIEPWQEDFMLRQRQWKEIKGLNRPREIVGLFKLSKPGVEFFLEEWNLALPQGTIAVNPWQVAAGSKLEPRESVDTIDCLMGDFLGYLHMRYEDRKRKKDGNDKYTKLRFKLKTVSAGWHEIDHWGDYVRAIERIESKDADRLVLS